MVARRTTCRLGLWLLGAWLALAPVAVSASVDATLLAPPADERVQNQFIQVLTNENGQFTIGTLQGDPGTRDDDNRRLMYGHGQSRYTSFTSARVIEGARRQDVRLLYLGSHRPQVAGDGVTAEWTVGNVLIRQTLAPAGNPFTERPDTVAISTTVTNQGNQPAQAGIRVMIDTMIGDNDDAPFFIPGTGNTNVEQDYGQGSIPPYWKAFEGPDYNPASLKGQGILTGFGASQPDRFVVAHWPAIKDTAWDYDVRQGTPLGDSAVAIYWNPVELAPGASTTWVTYYGLAGAGGGSAWIDAPVSVTSASPEFDATLWVSNRSDADFVGGEARITLPAGLQLAPGESGTRPFPQVPLNGGAQSVTWRLVAGGDSNADYPYSAAITFRSGSAPLSADARVSYRFVPATNTPTATVPPTPAPSLTPTPAATPAPVLVPPPPPSAGIPWWPWLLLPLAGLPLLFLLFRRRPRQPRPTAPPPRHGRSPAPGPGTERPAPRSSPAGSDVTHGRRRRA